MTYGFVSSTKREYSTASKNIDLTTPVMSDVHLKVHSQSLQKQKQKQKKKGTLLQDK